MGNSKAYQMARLSANRWLVVIVGCALFAAALASEEVSMLHDMADPAPEFPVPKLTFSVNPHTNATKGSVNGPVDPGYGQANATIRKQEYESMAQKINSNIADRIQQEVDAENDKIKQASTMTAIKSQSIRIKNKFRKARRLIKVQRKADKLAAKKARRAARKAKEQKEDDEDSGVNPNDRFAISAEEGKLQQEEQKNGVDTDAPPDFVNGKVDIAPSGNWVRPGRP